MDFIKKHAPQYTVYLVLVTGEIDEVATRIAARQEYNMPYQSEPFWRRVPTNVGSVEDLMSRNEAAFNSLEKHYGDDKRSRFERITNKMNASRLPPVRNFNADSALERIRAAYNSELGMPSINRNSNYTKTNTGRRSINVPYNTSGAPRAGAGEDPHPSKTHNRNTRNRNARNRNTRNRNTRRRQ
jgi:hypothetical protein